MSLKANANLQGILRLGLNQASVRIDPNIYGQFAEHLGRGIYEGLWVGDSSRIPNTRGLRKDVIGALKRLRVPVIRWPGGCFADEYHWKDGIGPREQRPRMLNSNWGGVVESNHFGTHEFMDLCEQIGAMPYVCGNVGSGSVEEMMQWVEYMTSNTDTPIVELRRKNGRPTPWRLPYFGVGNESWGCGGNMRPEYYADNFRRYNTFVKNYSGNTVARIACGANGTDTRWTEVLMREAGSQMNGLSLHWYSLPTSNWSLKGSATQFGEEEWFSTLVQTLKMDELLGAHRLQMDKYDPQRRVGLIIDEWGTWYDAEPGTNPGFLYQQSTLRDAVAAAINLNIFHKHCDHVTMTNIAQMVNVLQSVILTNEELMLLTPTYHVFDMYKVHQGAVMVPLELEVPDYVFGASALPVLSASASRDAEGRVHLSLVNLDPHREIRVTVPHAFSAISGAVLTAPMINAMNTFSSPNAVTPIPYRDFDRSQDILVLRVPSKSVVALELQ